MIPLWNPIKPNVRRGWVLKYSRFFHASFRFQGANPIGSNVEDEKCETWNVSGVKINDLRTECYYFVCGAVNKWYRYHFSFHAWTVSGFTFFALRFFLWVCTYDTIPWLLSEWSFLSLNSLTSAPLELLFPWMIRYCSFLMNEFCKILELQVSSFLIPRFHNILFWDHRMHRFHYWRTNYLPNWFFIPYTWVTYVKMLLFEWAEKLNCLKKIDELGLHVILWFKCNMFRYNF